METQDARYLGLTQAIALLGSSTNFDFVDSQPNEGVNVMQPVDIQDQRESSHMHNVCVSARRSIVHHDRESA